MFSTRAVSISELPARFLRCPRSMVKRKKVVIALGDIPPFDEGARAVLKAVAETREMYGRISERDLMNEIEDANAVILAQPILSRKTIESSGNLEIIVRFGVGIDNVDLKAATERGISVVNFPDALTEPVAEHAILLMLAAARNLNIADRSARDGRWGEFARGLRTELWRKKLGVVGFGRIGASIALKARSAFDMTVLGYEHCSRCRERIEKAGFVPSSLDRLLGESDVICLATSLTQESEGMIGKNEFGMMKNTAILINISRGRVVDEAALYEALKSGQLRGAGLDVLAKEPPETDSPLLGLDNVVLTPHCSAHTREMYSRLSFGCAEAIVSFFRGESPQPPANTVNPEAIKQRMARGARGNSL